MASSTLVVMEMFPLPLVREGQSPLGQQRLSALPMRNKKMEKDTHPIVSRESIANINTREPLKRRHTLPLFLTLLLCPSPSPRPAAAAAASTRVRLKDVENGRMQAALRAAVAGDLATAESMFSELIQEAPESASLWSNRGSVRLSMKKYEEAALDLTKATQLAPQAPVPFLNRAIAFEALGRYEEAMKDCQTAIRNDPEEYAAWFNLGNVDVRVKDYDSALSAYEKASALAPGIAGYRLKQALVLFELKRSEESRKLMQGLVRKYPNYAEAHAALAAVLWSEGDRSNAEEQFSEATSRESLYRNITWVGTELQWPPSMVKAMGNFLSIS